MSNKLKRRPSPPNISYLPQLQRISSALRRLAIAASSNFGSDCFMHVTIARELLTRLGIETTLVCGYAAWRVNIHDPDIVIHAPLPDTPLPLGSFPYHMWLEIDDHLLDFTTYQLKHKIGYLNQLDGGTTTCLWCPDFLFVSKKTISSLWDVIQLRTGMYFYQHAPELEVRILAASIPLDEEDVATAWMLYQNQELQLFGPNNMR
ncbi:MAG: hypothetical protein HIU83_03690 [Proteobacteria bacterium]|nr:hypothetical protein [Pseudomonadota bacterium]